MKLKMRSARIRPNGCGCISVGRRGRPRRSGLPAANSARTEAPISFRVTVAAEALADLAQQALMFAELAKQLGPLRPVRQPDGDGHAAFAQVMPLDARVPIELRSALDAAHVAREVRQIARAQVGAHVRSGEQRAQVRRARRRIQIRAELAQPALGGAGCERIRSVLEKLELRI